MIKSNIQRILLAGIAALGFAAASAQAVFRSYFIPAGSERFQTTSWQLADRRRCYYESNGGHSS